MTSQVWLRHASFLEYWKQEWAHALSFWRRCFIEGQSSNLPKFFQSFSLTYQSHRSEQPLRTSIWFSMNGVANILGGLIAYGIGHINSALPAWKYPFVIFGSVTILWGVFFVIITPSNPTKARWLSAREKEVATLRVLQNETGIDNKSFKMEQVKEALLDIRFWLINLLCLANTIPNVCLPSISLLAQSN